MLNHGWSRALDLQMDQHKWQLTDLGIDFTTSFFMSMLGKATDYDESTIDSLWQNPHQDPELFWNAASLTNNLTVALWRADTIYLTTDMQHLIMQAGHDLPEEATFDFHTLITPCGFCLFEETIYGTDIVGKTIAIKALAWNLVPIARGNPDEAREALSMYFFTPIDDPHDDINNEILPKIREKGVKLGPFALGHWYATLEGQKVPRTGLPGSELITELLALFVAMNLVAQQRIGTPMVLDPDRATRRRMKRDFGDDGPERRITLITLRRKSVKKDDEEPKKVEWSRRWPVRGHWRRQWYPKLKRHDWVYIYEYIKGPEDKPLVITERRIFNFRR